MNENLFETQYDVTRKSKLKKLYEGNKFLVFSALIVLIIVIVTLFFYTESQKKKRLALANNYIKAKIYLENNVRNEATDILTKLILANDNTYSTLSFFLILNENLITDDKELLKLFDHILRNNKFDSEITNLIIFKKLLFQSNFAKESELLEIAKPLITSETVWKPHALLLIGDYFISKNEHLKAKEFYMQILSLKNLHKDFYDHARLQLALTIND